MARFTLIQGHEPTPGPVEPFRSRALVGSVFGAVGAIPLALASTIYAVLRAHRGSTALGPTIPRIWITYLLVLPFFGFVAFALLPWAQRSRLRVTSFGAVLGALGICILAWPTESFESWIATVPWYAAIGGVFGAGVARSDESEDAGPE